MKRLVGGYANFEHTESRCVVVDAMLGWLARWLRMLGLDTRYDPNVSDEELINEEECVIVTRDLQVFKSARGPAVLLLSDNHVEWLAAVAQALGMDLEVKWDRTRCPHCNTPLVLVDRQDVEGKVPPRVKSTLYWSCPSCGQVYWVGSHWRNIERVLREARNILRGNAEGSRT